MTRYEEYCIIEKTKGDSLSIREYCLKIVILMIIRTTCVNKKCHLETLLGNLIPSVQTQDSGAKSKETRFGSKRDIILINNLEEIILT